MPVFFFFLLYISIWRWEANRGSKRIFIGFGYSTSTCLFFFSSPFSLEWVRFDYTVTGVCLLCPQRVLASFRRDQEANVVSLHTY